MRRPVQPYPRMGFPLPPGILDVRRNVGFTSFHLGTNKVLTLPFRLFATPNKFRILSIIQALVVKLDPNRYPKRTLRPCATVLTGCALCLDAKILELSSGLRHES